MKIFLNRPRTMSHKLREGPDVLTLHPVPVTHSDGAYKIFKVPSCILPHLSFKVTYESDK